MPKKVQTMLLVTPQIRERANVLALILDEPRAEIYRLALENGGLPWLERRHSGEITELDVIAKALGMDRYELAKNALEEKQSFSEVRAMGARLAA